MSLPRQAAAPAYYILAAAGRKFDTSFFAPKRVPTLFCGQEKKSGQELPIGGGKTAGLPQQAKSG
jgi:hypothetical protein